MPPLSTPAVVLRSLNYGESDRIVTFFTKDFGKLKGIAKGARRSRKRFQNALDLFSHVRLGFFEKERAGLVRIDSCDILQSFKGIREDLKKICYGTYFLELIDEMAGEREAHREAYDLLVFYLSSLEAAPPREEQLRIFETRTLSIFGFRPNLNRCDGCKKDWRELKDHPSLFFSIEKGALVCDRCQGAMGLDLVPLSLGAARLIEQISRMELSKIERLRFTPQALLETRNLLGKFIVHQLGKELRSLKVLKEMG